MLTFFIKRSSFIYLAVRGNCEPFTASPLSLLKNGTHNSPNGKGHEKWRSSFWFLRIKISRTFSIALFFFFWLGGCLSRPWTCIMPSDPWGDIPCREGQSWGEAEHTTSKACSSPNPLQVPTFSIICFLGKGTMISLELLRFHLGVCLKTLDDHYEFYKFA